MPKGIENLCAHHVGSVVTKAPLWWGCISAASYACVLQGYTGTHLCYEPETALKVNSIIDTPPSGGSFYFLPLPLGGLGLCLTARATQQRGCHSPLEP